MNVHYRGRYPKPHRGMVEIAASRISAWCLSTSATTTRTPAAALTGSYWQLIDGDYRVLHSAAAYKHVYPLLLGAIDAGNDEIVVEDSPVKLTHRVGAEGS